MPAVALRKTAARVCARNRAAAALRSSAWRFRLGNRCLPAADIRILQSPEKSDNKVYISF